MALVSRLLRAYFSLQDELVTQSHFVFREPGHIRDSPIPDEDNKWHAVSKFVGTWRWTRRVGTRQFVQKPVRWRTQTLLVLLPVHECLG